MNLVVDKWIPVMIEGEAQHVSLLEVFQKAENIKDLAVDPVQRIALMRLLICITQAALDGPQDEDDWLDCREKIVPEVAKYLNDHQDCFDLYGDKAFLQIPDLEVKEGEEKSFDFISLPNNTSLFQHSLGNSGSTPSDQQMVLDVLCFQNFSCSGKVGQSRWRGTQYSGSAKRAPCLNYLHLIIHGPTFLDTIWLNLLTKHGAGTGVDKLPNGKWGRPVWEQFPESPNDTEAFENSRETYLGRLVPLSRFVRLGPPWDRNKCIVGPPMNEQEYEQLPSFREPSSVVVLPKKDTEDLRYFRIYRDAHMWRDLHALLAWRADDFAKTNGPPSLYHLLQMEQMKSDWNAAVWVGGLQLGNYEGKLRDMAEWRFEFPLQFLDEALRSEYAVGVAFCDNVFKKALYKAVTEYMSFFDQAGLRRKSANSFWTELDGVSRELQRIAVDESKNLALDWFPMVRQAAINAYESSCPHTTPRQIMAYSAGLKRLRWQLRKVEGDEQAAATATG